MLGDDMGCGRMSSEPTSDSTQSQHSNGADRSAVLDLGRAIVLAPEQQLAIWVVLAAPVQLTDAQKALGRLMRGEAALNPPC